jgi:hypothetical protein
MRASWLMAFALVLVGGCSSSGGGGPGGPNADSYAGMWTFQTGSIVPNCNLTASDIDLTGQPMTITKTDSSHIAVVVNATGATCDVNFTVNGATATVASGQTCMISDNGITATVNVTSWTLTLSGSQLSMSMSGSASAAGGLVTCTPTSTGTLNKADAG